MEKKSKEKNIFKLFVMRTYVQGVLLQYISWIVLKTYDSKMVSKWLICSRRFDYLSWTLHLVYPRTSNGILHSTKKALTNFAPEDFR